MKKQSIGSLLALGAAVIWGLAFVAQTKNTLGTWWINALRAVIAFVFLLPVIAVFTKGGPLLKEEDPSNTRRLWLGGVLCGLALAAATFCQQNGIDQGVPAGKAGFITALYMSLVPVFSLFLKKKVRWFIWLAAGLAVLALYLLCVHEGFSIEGRDSWVILCAVLFAIQIMIIDHYAGAVNCIRLSCIQFLTMAVISLIPALFTGLPSAQDIGGSLLPILYLGIGSSGIAYTLQMLAQKDGDPAAVSILLSMESVFSVIFGAIINKEVMSGREYLGCVIMFAAVLLTQWDLLPWNVKKKRLG